MGMLIWRRRQSAANKEEAVKQAKKPAAKKAEAKK